ncbi:hypothetical protein BABINDRAFT_14696 [Babjeviella inositovora NRRL Y-12698]|uniref:Globin domain-containing protein n=1 Tax=Babjeviella inositovora NRRL Y-12698 TaxID=984486 RepID=A0A1E3QLQ8_9ASCO|nr:uncharacterized protein BABINDRAFT_14696 [Babjeviella inositovora NRRL Y-12698]ODQ78548.1 hypothetical protein BABINDRAFT_14696 [Babjeviella inositovora NRRL Y-12698]
MLSGTGYKNRNLTTSPGRMPLATTRRSNISKGLSDTASALFDRENTPAILYDESSLTSTEEESLGPEYNSKKAVRSTTQRLTKVELVLTPEEIRILRASWSLNVTDTEGSDNSSKPDTIVRPSSTMFASTYFWRQVYETLLETNPELERVIPSIQHQTTSFAGIMYTAINNLENLSAMDEFMGNLGRRHGRVFNVQPAYFKAMGVALIETFQDRYGESFTNEISSLWARLYCFLANSLIQASYYDPVLSQDLLIFPTLLKRESTMALGSTEMLHESEEERESDDIVNVAMDEFTQRKASSYDNKLSDIMSSYGSQTKRLGSFASRLFKHRTTAGPVPQRTG